MKASVLLMILLFAVSSAGCGLTATASECDGWEKMTPSASLRKLMISGDRPFANQVASHNAHGRNRKCWE